MSSKKREPAIADDSLTSIEGRHTSIKSTGKRKLADTSSQSNHPTTPEQANSGKRAKYSVAELLSSSPPQSYEDTDDSRPTKRRSLHNEAADTIVNTNPAAGGSFSDSSSTSPRTVSFAEMYTFRTKSVLPAKNGVIDLSKGSSTSPARNPMLNGLNKSTFNPHQGPKKLLVKNIKTVQKEDQTVFFDRKWKEQDAALDRLFTDPNAKLLLEELYKGAEYICRQGLSRELYGRLKQKCTEHLDKRLRTALRATSENSSPIEALKSFVHIWTLWQTQIQTIRHIFFYLNQTYLLRSADEPDLDVMGLQLFRTVVFQDVVSRQAVLAGAVELVGCDRSGTISNEQSHLAKQAISTFHDLGVYNSDFEPALAKASKDYFRSWKQSEVGSSELPQYVQSCTELLGRETTRCDSWLLDQSTKKILTDQIDEILIEEDTARLTQEDAVLDMFEANMVNELKQDYSLLLRIGQQYSLSAPFAKFIETDGTAIVFDEKEESDMVVRLLQFKRKLDQINKISFDDNETMGNTLHKAFEVFMNKTKKTQSNWDTDNAKPGEMIAKHVDLLLKGGPKAVPGLRVAGADEEQDFDNDGTDEKEVEKHLDDALDLFRFVHGKAVFEAFYKKDLARRLLMGRTQSFDAERSMLTRLKNECGAGFTHNLESMFKDMDLAREEMKSYNQLLSDRGIRPKPDLSVNVLSVAAWPTYTDIPVNLPTSISKAQADFEKHYKEKHVGRKLAWKPALAHCQLKAFFPKGNKEIVVSGFQALVLLLFNDTSDTQKLSYADIKAATALPDNELTRTLQSLACAKYRVLTKHPKGRDVNQTDHFTFNTSFTDSKLRIKINQIQLKETKEENKETHQRVAADRHYETQAAIVRIMKSKKVVGHNELIVEVIKATRSRGVLDQGDIKKNIEK